LRERKLYSHNIAGENLQLAEKEGITGKDILKMKKRPKRNNREMEKEKEKKERNKAAPGNNHLKPMQRAHQCVEK